MFKFRAYLASMLFAWLALLLTGCATQRTQSETKTTVDEARTTLENFLRDPDMTWMHRHVKEAKAVIISPRLLQAGFIIGGAGGPGVAMARGRSPGTWNGPAFYKIAIGSIGLQAGVQQSEMVILVMSQKALDSMLTTSFKLGADVSVAAGPVGVGAGKEVTADMVVFTRSKGLYGGINLSGTVISVDDVRNTAFYGKDARPIDILIERRVSSPDAAPLERLLSKVESSSGAQ
jgi:lipid-binding SYLF domain-containing protein